MDFNAIIQVISSLGFPIVCCGAAGWYVKYQSDKNSAQIDKIMEQHHSEMKEVTTALNNNTLAITKLTDYIERNNND